MRLLEIGVQNGGSLEVWARYFDNGQAFVGVDINPDCGKLAYSDPRISVVIGDAARPETQKKIFETCDVFDVIIEDGSHTSPDIIRTFATMFPHLTTSGVYIAEDMCCGYWKDFDGGLDNPMSAPSFFKALSDCVNAEHWDVDRTPSDYLKPFADFYSFDAEAIGLDQLHAVTARNSMFVVEKSSAKANTIGPRIVRGGEALVEPRVLEMDNTLISSVRQSD